MEWETGLFPTEPTVPALICDTYELQYWLYLEHRFRRFEQLRSVSNPATQTCSQEAVHGGVLPNSEEGDCSMYNYLDKNLLTLFEDVVFPDLDMLQPLPPLDHHCDNYQQVQYPCLQNGTSSSIDNAMTIEHVTDVKDEIRAKSSWVRMKSEDLEFEHVQRYFDRPILEAAKELRIGLTLLKKRCRELGIRRWPHRKLRSLNSLINNVKELGLEMEVSMLEEQRKMLVEQPEMELNQRAKKIRQKSFKANHMRKRKKKAALLILPEEQFY